MNIIEQFETDQIKTLIKGKKIPQFHPGDTVKVNVKVRDCLLYTSDAADE